LAIEIVSPSNSAKDYQSAPDKYAASGTRELWILDPKLAGPKMQGGLFRIQIWRRDDADETFTRIHAGDGPAWSPAVRGWLFSVDEGRSIRIAADQAGTCWWKTTEEAERSAKQAERSAKEAALRRVAELEAKLARS
jgi:hypothetical protein